MSFADELEKLNNLKQDGALTEAEYQEAKTALLAEQQGGAPQPQRSVPSESIDENTWGLIIHLSQFCVFVIPLAGLIAPIVLWQIKKRDSDLLDRHGRIVANWILTAFILSIIFGFLCIILVGIPFVIALGVVWVVFPIIGSVKASTIFVMNSIVPAAAAEIPNTSV